MKVFISWSGDRSKETAEVLKEWLPKVIQALKPWISVEIGKGKKWNKELSDALEESKVGIICLNRDNLYEPWILFEAGAIAKTKDSRACIFLLDLEPPDVPKPLGDLMATRFEKEDFKKLMHDINEVLKEAGKESLNQEFLNSVFETFWPDLEAKLTAIKNAAPKKESPKRGDRELLEEILEMLRGMQQEKDLQITYTGGLMQGIPEPALSPSTMKIILGEAYNPDEIRRKALDEFEKFRPRENVARPKKVDSTDK